MVLGAGGAAWITAVEADEGEADQLGEAAGGEGVAFGLVDQAEGLVEPDGDVGLLAEDEAVGRSGLGLGKGPCAAVFAAGELAPAVGEVAVEVDPTGVAAGAGGRRRLG